MEVFFGNSFQMVDHLTDTKNSDQHKNIPITVYLPATDILVPKDFLGAPLLPGNTVDIATIQSQRIYYYKYQTIGQWIHNSGKISTVFYYGGKQYCLPFGAIFKPELLHWLKESAILQMEDAIEEQLMAESGFQGW